jgi:hypothetical protein
MQVGMLVSKLPAESLSRPKEVGSMAGELSSVTPKRGQLRPAGKHLIGNTMLVMAVF